MRLITLLTIFAVAGCAQKYDTNSLAYRQCQYEARKATPYNANAFIEVMREAELINMCMGMKQ